MVTTTTKKLTYSIIRGNHTNAVDATITSTPGFNVNYFAKIPGILKIIELIVTVVALGLAASRRREGFTNAFGWHIEYFLAGEVFFICICAAGLTYLFGQLTTFAWSVVSSVLIPKTTYFEMVINLLLFLAWLTAGIVELAMTSREGWNGRPQVVIAVDAFNNPIISGNPPTTTTTTILNPPNMLYSDWGCRIAAGSLGLFLAVFHLISFVVAVQEFVGKRNQG